MKTIKVYLIVDAYSGEVTLRKTYPYDLGRTRVAFSLAVHIPEIQRVVYPEIVLIVPELTVPVIEPDDLIEGEDAS